MKNYQKPQVDIMGFNISEKITSLASWLENGENEYREAGITTYVVES